MIIGSSMVDMWHAMVMKHCSEMQLRLVVPEYVSAYFAMRVNNGNCVGHLVKSQGAYHISALD